MPCVMFLKILSEVRVYLRPATPRTTKLSLVNVPVLSKQQTSTFPANGILKGSVQNTSMKGEEDKLTTVVNTVKCTTHMQRDKK